MKTGFLLFMLLPLAGNVYVLWHVWRMLPFAVWGKWAVVVLMLAAFVLLFVYMRFHASLPMPVATVVYEVSTSWLVILLYLLMLFLVMDVASLLLPAVRPLLKDSWAGSAGVLLAMLAVFTYGYVNYLHKVRQPLTLTTEKPLRRPLKVIMMSDLHLGYHNRRPELARWVDMLNREKADLILIAGDLIDISTRPLDHQHMEEELLRLNAPVVACLGNHEYYAGQPDAAYFFRKADIRLLRDSVITVGDLCIIGRDDRTNLRRKSVAELMKAADASKYTILLDHQPYHLEEAERAGVDFQLSGHTHRGQVWPLSWITDALYECSFGSWQRGRTRYYVSSGMGIWGGKFRIGTRSEYVVAEIVSEEKQK